MPVDEKLDLPSWRSLDLEARLRWALAPEIPDSYRQALAQEQWMQTRCYFARRQDLHTDEVAHFANDGDYVIRLCIAKRPDLTPEQVSTFCTDRDPNVRYAIARNPLLSGAQRQMLLNDPDEVVQQAAAKGARPSQTRQRKGQAALYR
ncbi:hypothetical protein AB4090_07535 [Acidithiobacillus sp. IBUN Pt1247-S3]|uniref:hypothetical protein n=1 Tax=Acidithiobacillus sp. IBUN Pt1247-S3 TaxID=3166642 RepID=UPI0034E5A650